MRVRINDEWRGNKEKEMIQGINNNVCNEAKKAEHALAHHCIRQCGI